MKKGSNKPLIIAAIVIAVMLIAAGIFGYANHKAKQSNGSESSSASAAGDAGEAKFSELDISMPPTEGPKTWLLVGHNEQDEAKLVLVVTEMADATRGMIIPTDLVVNTEAGDSLVSKIWDPQGQGMVNTSCIGLNIPVDHLMSFNIDLLPQLVEQLGGIEVEVDESLTELGFEAGKKSLDASQAKSWLVEESDPLKAPYSQALVMRGLLTKLSLDQLAAVSDQLSVDAQASLADFEPVVELESVQVLTVHRDEGADSAIMDHQAERNIYERGYHEECQIG